ncbi:solute carrier family 12 member 2-like isoform X2 [Oscarella lobularis]|uniref:solute carrier family 12 member 2-like isoform X2 n=1 Tax=Oscarella lobularis TaxID=121494 RepID=UPI0033132DC2
MARKKTRFDIEDVEDDTYSLEETMGISLALKESERGLHSDANSPSKTIASRFSAMTPEKTSPGTPESDIGSLSYTKTAEAVPMTLLYRQDSAQRGAELPRRPTLKDLHDPIQIIDENGIEERVEEERVSPERSAGEKKEVKFGWMSGVLIRCLLNIWGVIMFLRLTWVVGQAGIGMTVLIIALSAIVTTITTLSMSAICTNGEVKGGGAYYLISRSLGPEFGGAIGIVFSIANAVGVALYVVGFSETVRDLIKDTTGGLMTDEENDVRIIGCITVALLLGIALVGLDWEARAQLILLGILLLAVANFVVGTFIGPKNLREETEGFLGYKADIYFENWYPVFQGETFFSVFAIFFPAATGILAGANLSGDLKDPSKAIPKGTLWSIAISSIVYIGMAWMAGSCAIREATGPLTELAANSSNCSLSDIECIVDHVEGKLGRGYYLNCTGRDCEYGLLNSYQIMNTMSGVGPIIIAGVFSATLSSALASLVSAPKVFQAVSKDKIFPYIHFFAKAGGRSGTEPVRGYLLTFVVAIAFVLIGKLDAIAPIISNFFLMSYALINFSCFNASLAQSPGWRPGFKYYNMWVALIGSLLCLAIMFVMNWWTALLTIVVVAGLVSYVVYKKPNVNWGSSSSALLYIGSLKSLFKLQETEDHVKNFRPQLLVLTGLPSLRPGLVHFASQMCHNVGAVICGQVILGKFEDNRTVREASRRDTFIKTAKIKAFHTIVTAPSLRQGADNLMEASGLGKIKPNTVLIGYKTDWKSSSAEDIEAYVNIIHDAFDLNYGVAILRVAGGFYWRKTAPVQLAEMTDAGTLPVNSPGTIRHGSDWLGSELKATLESERRPSGTRFVVGDEEEKEEEGEEEEEEEERDRTAPPSKTPSQSDLLHGHDIELLSRTYFNRSQRGTIDVWWLYDDGGLTVLLPHLLSLNSHWRKCKLRVLTPESSKKITGDKLRMTSLLRKFRIDFSNVVIVDGSKSTPSHGSVDDFKTHLGEEPFPSENPLKDKTLRHIRLGELLRRYSSQARLIVMTLPIPRKHFCTPRIYMSWLETLTADLPPILLVRGNHENVLTLYS